MPAVDRPHSAIQQRNSAGTLNSAENLILLCGEHHTIVDASPRTYTVDVLLEMKRRHEAPFVAEPVQSAPTAVTPETLLSSLLVVSELPRCVWAAPYLAAEPREVAAAIRWPASGVAVPFICREGRVFAFHNLAAVNGPFADAVDRGATEVLAVRDLRATPDGQRWNVDLLNRALSWHLRDKGLRFDRDHDRHFFTLREDGTAPRVEYRSKTGRAMSREVVREAVRRNGGLGDSGGTRRRRSGSCSSHGRPRWPCAPSSISPATGASPLADRW